MITFKAPLTGSDLILKEQNPFDGYTRADVTVTLTTTQVLQLGAPLKRAKGVGGAKWTPVAAAGDLVDTNEIAFYLADTPGLFRNVGPAVVGDVVVAAIVRGNIILKDKAIADAVKLNFAAVADADLAKVKEMAATQGIVIEKVLA